MKDLKLLLIPFKHNLYLNWISQQVLLELCPDRKHSSTPSHSLVTNPLLHMLATLSTYFQYPTPSSCNSYKTVTDQGHSQLLQIPARHIQLPQLTENIRCQSVCLQVHEDSIFLFSFTFWFSALATRICAFKNVFHLPLSRTLSDEIISMHFEDPFPFSTKGWDLTLSYLMFSKLKLSWKNILTRRKNSFQWGEALPNLLEVRQKFGKVIGIRKGFDKFFYNNSTRISE